MRAVVIRALAVLGAFASSSSAARLAGRTAFAARLRWPSRLDHDPEAVARWLVRHDPDVAFRDGEPLDAWRRERASTDAERAEATAGALLRTWMTATLARCHPPGAGHVEVLRRAMEAVAEVMVTAYEVPLHEHPELFSHWAAPSFAAGAPGRLLRGISNCDGINHLLAELIAPRVQSYLALIPSHRLVQARVGGAFVFLDAQSILPPFSLAARPPDGVLTYPELSVRHRNTAEHEDRVEPRRRYARVHGRVAVSPLPPTGWPRGVPGPGRVTVGAPGPTDVRARYLDARVHHLFGASPRAADAYRGVLESTDPSATAELLRAAAGVFLERLEGAPLSRAPARR